MRAKFKNQRRLIACIFATLTALFAPRPTPAHAVTVTLSNSVIGQTPEIIGYNSGHFMPGSNTASWWRYTQANGARVWSTPSTVENNDDNSVWGDGVASEPQFVARRAALRANPTDASYINWPYLENRYQNVPTDGSNNINLAYAFGQLHEMGVDPVVEMHRTSERYPFDPPGTAAGWADRWEQWQHFYAQAFYLAKNFDVRRFQMYNEPNHSANSIAQAEYIERLRLASDAVQSAVADVNALFGKSLDVQMHAPVTAGGSSVFNQRPGGDPRDDQVGWGELVMDNLQVNYLGQVDPEFQLIDTYAVQLYNMNGPGFASEVQTLKSLINAAAGGAPIRVAITEFNVHTAAVFEGTAETMDSPSKFSTLGLILANLANARVDELYLQKFSLTADDSASGVKKNGLHYVDNVAAPYDIGGITKGGEVSRLFNKGFAGGHELLAKPIVLGTAVNVLHLAAAYNSQERRHSIFSANSGTSDQELTLDMNSIGVEPGTILTIEEVSAQRQGEVRQFLEVPAGGVVTLTQPRESVFLVTAPDSPPAYRVTLAAADDAVVRPRRNATYNFGGDPTLFAENDDALPESRGVTFLKFDLDDIPTESVEQAILRVHGGNEGTDATVITHIYGLLGDNWNEETITWNNAPNLKDSLGAVNDISHNFIEGVGTTAEIVGHFTGVQTAREMMFDVTPFVESHPDQEITFLIAREVRFDGENVDDALSSLRLDSKESGVDPGPQLILSLNASALPADFNGDGVVDGEDLAAWTAGIGEGAAPSAGDADGDGDADGADFLQWQQALGSHLTANLAAAASAVPEPLAAHLGLHAAYFVALLHRLFMGLVR